MEPTPFHMRMSLFFSGSDRLGKSVIFSLFVSHSSFFS